MKRRNGFAALNAVFGMMVLAGMVCYMSTGGIQMKAASCLMFVLLSGVNLVYACVRKAERAFAGVMFAGAVAGWLGDVLLGVNFILGTGLFAAGHVLYLVALGMLVPFRRKDAVLMTAILAGTAAFVLLYPAFDFGGAVMQTACLIYGMIISCMVGKAVMNGLDRRTIPFVMMAAGSVLFYFSDLMLVLRHFADAPRLADRLCLLTYFPAQGLLASSVYFIVSGKEAK